MRIDRLISVDLFHAAALVQKVSGISLGGSRRLPILMYHSVSDYSESNVSPYYRTVTSPARFAAQMAWLSESGWRGVTLREGLGSLADGICSREKLVAITFDDGFCDFLSVAFPILKRHDFSATMYLPTGFIGETRQKLMNRECLNWKEVVTLHERGVEFGSHTEVHPALYELSWKLIRREVIKSRQKIEAILHYPVISFSYPYAYPQPDAEFTAKFRQLLKESGYKNAVTTVVGRANPNSDLMELRRLPINSCDDKSLLMAKLNGGYDWFSYPQSLWKLWKHWSSKRQRNALDIMPDTSP